MNKPDQIFIFGEVLFDCFPSGEQVLGGAPFNVAWHLQALKNKPQFISSVGNDALGQKISDAMTLWGMDTSTLQIDSIHQTGRVEVNVIESEPHYDITPDCAYDFIDMNALNPLPKDSFLYHGSLALRNPVSRHALDQLIEQSNPSVFLDVNLRSPWWQKTDIYQWLSRASWVKLNQDELALLGFNGSNIEQEMLRLHDQFNLDQVIVTRGEQGAIVATREGEFHSVIPDKVTRFIDTVGAGDAFTAQYIHGLLTGRSISDTLAIAQKFACRVIGLRGATSTDVHFYDDFID